MVAAHGEAPTHVVTFEPMYQIELCIPPWEQPDRNRRVRRGLGSEHERVFRPTGPRRGRVRDIVVARTTRATRWRSTAR